MFKTFEFIKNFFKDFFNPTFSSDLEMIKMEVEAYTLDLIVNDCTRANELNEFKDFDSFFDFIDQSNGYEETWEDTKEYYKPMYRIVYQELMEKFNKQQKGKK